MSYQICTRCVMDTSDTEIMFDANGYCNHCSSALSRLQQFYLPNEQGKKVLEATIDAMKKAGKNKPYDCVIGLSGGVDSSYLAYKAKDWGLRPLLFHVDGGWNSAQSSKNIELLANYLKFDLHTHTVVWEEMQDLQVAYLKAALANQDVPQDHLFFAALLRAAEKAGITHFLSGSNLVSESILPVAWGYSAMDSRQIKAIHKKFGKRLLKHYPMLSFYEYCKFYGNLPFFPAVQIFKPLNLIPYNVISAKAEMKAAYGWQDYGRKHDESLFTKVFQNYYLPTKFGYEKRRAHLASLIASGLITREVALLELQQPLYEPQELAADIQNVCEKLELSEADWNAIMQTPNKHYTDYPNVESLIHLGRKVKRLLVRPGQV